MLIVTELILKARHEGFCMKIDETVYIKMTKES